MPRHGQPHHGRHGHSRHHYSQVEQPSRWSDGGPSIRSGIKECKMYRQNGFCSFGSNCRFSHDKAPSSRPTTPLTPLVHHSPLSSLTSAGSQAQHLGSPAGKSGGLIYPSNSMGLGKGLSSLLLEQQHNINNNGTSLTANRGQNNSGGVANSCSQHLDGSLNGHRGSMAENRSIGGPNSMHLNLQTGGGFHESLVSSSLASGVMGYNQMPILDFGGGISEHFLSSPIQQIQGYQGVLGIPADSSKEAPHLRTGVDVGSSYPSQSRTSKSQSAFNSSTIEHLAETRCANGSESIDLQYVRAPEGNQSQKEGTPRSVELKSPKGPPPVFQESEYHHKGYFCSSWPYVPNPWHPPGVPNRHMQLQLQNMQSPRSKGPVTRTAFLLKPERKEHQDGPGYLPSKKTSPGKRHHGNAIFRTPHAVQLIAPQ